MQETEGLESFLREAKLVPGSRVLDVPCGIGRRALALARSGYAVTAVDPNEIGVSAAQQRVPPELQARLHFAFAPRDRLPGLEEGERFDAILALDHPLGRGPPEDDIAFLSRLRNHIVASGYLVVDALHRDYFAAHPRPFSFHVIGDIEEHEFRRFDPVTSSLRLEWKFYQRVGEDLKHRTDSAMDFVLETPRNIVAVLERAGWHASGVWGGWAREPVSADHRKVIVLATPAG